MTSSLFVSALVLLTIFECREMDSGILRGSVKDRSGKHLEGISFEISRMTDEGWLAEREGRSDEKGRFDLESLPTQTPILLRIPATDHWEGFRKSIILESDVVFLDITLLPRDRSASGVIVHHPSGAPVKGATMRVYEHPQIYRRTGPDGRFRIPGLAAVDYRLEVSHPLIPSVYTIYPIRGGDRDIKVVLPPEDSFVDPWPHPEDTRELIGTEAPPGSGRFIDEPAPDLSGQPIWLRFFTNYVKHSQRDVGALDEESVKGGVIILVHSASAWDMGLARWKQSQGLRLRVFMDDPLARDRDHSCSLTWARYGIRTIPVDVLIDPDRKIVAVGGAEDFEETLAAWRRLRDG